MIQLLNSDTSFLQAVPDRLLGKACRMLETVEALLFSRSNQPPIADDRSRRIPVISVNA